MNRIVTIIIFAAAIISNYDANAGNAGAGSIINPLFMQTGALLLSTDAAQSSAPSCATVANRWAIDATAPAGKLQASAILTAYAMGKRVVIFGTGTCSVWSDTETVMYLQIIN